MILRAFRPGTSALGNQELSERTGLSKSTVSRLTQTLVGMGFLQTEPNSRAYRLAPAVLSLALAMRSGSSALSAAAPWMRSWAQAHKVNVGLAAPDAHEMVYLESIRYSPRPSLRSVVSGQRIPMELTALGRAYLAGAPPDTRLQLLQYFAHTRQTLWHKLEPELRQAISQYASCGYCAASWQPGVTAVATYLSLKGTDFALNISTSFTQDYAGSVAQLAPLLLGLKQKILSTGTTI